MNINNKASIGSIKQLLEEMQTTVFDVNNQLGDNLQLKHNVLMNTIKIWRILKDIEKS